MSTPFVPPADFALPADRGALNVPMRHQLYQHALAGRGLNAQTPFRTLAALTTGLPGEIIELALTLEDGRHFSQRCRPSQPITPGAQRIHGLNDDALAQSSPLSSWIHRLQLRLEEPGPSGETVPVVCWSGKFTEDALAASVAQPSLPPLFDLQDVLSSVDQYLTPTRPAYPTSLKWLRILYGLAEPDKSRALSVAQTTRLATRLLLGPCP